jgi:hypothetical protein
LRIAASAAIAPTATPPVLRKSRRLVISVRCLGYETCSEFAARVSTNRVRKSVTIAPE